MKKIISVLMVITVIFAFSACSKNTDNNNTKSTSENQAVSNTTERQTEENKTVKTGKTLVVYYSASGNTENAAKYIAAATNGELFEIVPKDVYTDDDLDWRDENSRVNYEHENESARNIELVSEKADNWEAYDTVFIGYPNWWGDMPMILYTFFDTYDFSGKTIIPFNTHGGSGFSNTINSIKELEPAANVNDNGYTVSRNNVNESESEIIAWLGDLGYNK